MCGVGQLISMLIPAVDAVNSIFWNGCALKVDVDNSMVDNLDRAGSIVLGEIVLRAAHNTVKSVDCDDDIHHLPLRSRQVIRAATAAVTSVLDQVPSDTLGWSAGSPVVVFDPSFLHSIQSAVVMSCPGIMEKLRVLTTQMVDQALVSAGAAEVHRGLPCRACASSTAEALPQPAVEMLAVGGPPCSAAAVPAAPCRKGCRGRARDERWRCLNLQQPGATAAAAPAGAAAAAATSNCHKKRRSGRLHRFRRGVPEPVPLRDWSGLMRDAALCGLQSLQTVLSEILAECRSLAEAVRRMSRRHRVWQSLFVNHIRAVWPIPAGSSHEADDEAAEHTQGSANPEAEPAVCPSGESASADVMVELVVSVPNTLLLMALCRRVPQLKQEEALCRRAPKQCCCNEGTEAPDGSIHRLVLQIGLSDCVSDLAALICQKTGLFPTDFFIVSDGHRLLPDGLLQQCGLSSSGHALCCVPVKLGGSGKKRGTAAADRTGQPGGQPRACHGAAGAASAAAVPGLTQGRPAQTLGAGMALKFFPCIPNQGNDCFINASLQLLLPALDTVEARKTLHQPHKPGSDALQRLLADCLMALVRPSQAPNTQLWQGDAEKLIRLKQMLGRLMPKHAIGEQDDPAPIIEIILSKLPWFGNMFKFSEITNSQCTGACQTVYLQPAIVDHCFNITVEFEEDLGAAIDKAFQATHVHGVDCSLCKCQTSKIGKTVLNSLPAYLLVHIKGKPVSTHHQGRVDRVEQQALKGYRSLDLAGILNPEWGQVPATYSLLSAVMHLGGSAQNGHYIAQQYNTADPLMGVVISDHKSWPAGPKDEVQLQRSGRVLLFRRDQAVRPASAAAAGAESVWDIPAMPAAAAAAAGPT